MQAAIVIPLILQAVQAALAAAPQAVDIATKAKELITAYFTAKLITKEQQDAAHANVDSLQAMALAGILPAHWTVEPDPQ